MKYLKSFAACVSMCALAGCPAPVPTDSGVDTGAHDVQSADQQVDAIQPMDVATDSSMLDGALPPDVAMLDGSTGDATTTDAHDAAAEGGDAACDPGTGPATVALTSTIIIVGADGGMAAPTPTGGDPTGHWVAHNVTAYLPPTAAGVVMPAGSSVTGTAWYIFDATSDHINVNAVATAATAAGARMQAMTLQETGPYTGPTAGTITLSPTCASGTLAVLHTVGFSRLTATTAQLSMTIPVAIIGPSVFVYDLTIAP